MNQNMNKELYEAIRPARDNTTSKKSKKLWILGAIFLAFLLGVGYIGINQDNLTSDQVMAQIYSSNGVNISNLSLTLPWEQEQIEKNQILKDEMPEEEICYLNYSEILNQSLGPGY